MRNKKIVVIYYSDDWKKKIPINSAPTRESFEDWYERGQEKGIEMYRASIKWYDEENNFFKKVWTYRDKKWIKLQEKIKPDLIFDKIMSKRDYELFDLKMRISQKTKLFNHPLFRAITDSKLSQYLILKEFMPKTFLVTEKKELPGIMKKISSSKVVIKPIYGSGGFGITITEKKKSLNLRIKYPVIVQEFIKSENGIPCFSKMKEVSDLRLIFMNHKFIYALSRIAKKGSLFTNFHQGATAVIIPRKTIPKNIQNMVSKIIEKLKIFPYANYSLDFIFTNTGQPFLVEMNTTPGFDLLHIVGDEKTKNKNFEEFISILKS